MDVTKQLHAMSHGQLSGNGFGCHRAGGAGSVGQVTTPAGPVAVNQAQNIQ